MKSASRGRSVAVCVAWCAWALVFLVSAVEFDLAAGTYFILFLIAELALAALSYQVTGRRVFLLLLLLPALPLLALALPARLGADSLRLMAVTIPPLVAASVVHTVASERLRATRGFRVTLALVAIVALAVDDEDVVHCFAARRWSGVRKPRAVCRRSAL